MYHSLLRMGKKPNQNPIAYSLIVITLKIIKKTKKLKKRTKKNSETTIPVITSLCRYSIYVHI